MWLEEVIQKQNLIRSYRYLWSEAGIFGSVCAESDQSKGHRHINLKSSLNLVTGSPAFLTEYGNYESKTLASRLFLCFTMDDRHWTESQAKVSDLKNQTNVNRIIQYERGNVRRTLLLVLLISAGLYKLTGVCWNADTEKLKSSKYGAVRDAQVGRFNWASVCLSFP